MKRTRKGEADLKVPWETQLVLPFPLWPCSFLLYIFFQFLFIIFLFLLFYLLNWMIVFSCVCFLTHGSLFTFDSKQVETSAVSDTGQWVTRALVCLPSRAFSTLLRMPGSYKIYDRYFSSWACVAVIPVLIYQLLVMKSWSIIAFLWIAHLLYVWLCLLKRKSSWVLFLILFMVSFEQTASSLQLQVNIKYLSSWSSILKML